MVPPMVAPSPDPLPVMPTEPTSNNAPSDSISLRRSSRLSVAPNRYGFPALFSSLDSAPISISHIHRPQRSLNGRMR